MDTSSKKRLSPAAVVALKEALVNIYWYKNDLKQFVYQAISNKEFLATIDFTQLKRQTVEVLVGRMAARQDLYLEDLLSLVCAVVDMTDFRHLEVCEDAEEKIRKAKNSVAALRNHTRGYLQLQQEKQCAIENRKRYNAVIESNQAIKDELEKLKKSFYDMTMQSDSHKRGYDFEKFLTQLFTLYDLDPKCAYKENGEQIDGAFVHDSQNYLIEAKWIKGQIPLSSIYTFAGKVRSKLKTTLGLFIAVEGFSKDCIDNIKAEDIILMDSTDIICVVDNRIDLPTLLYRKKQRASQTGEVLFHPIGN